MQISHEESTTKLDLDLEDYDVNGASIGCGRDGTKFAVTIAAVSNATVNALERAAESHGRICLLLPRPLLLDLVTLEFSGLGKVTISGRVVGETMDAVWRPRMTGLRDQASDRSATYRELRRCDPAA
jgi:hypothetical protein